MLVGTVEQAAAYHDAGFRFLGCGSDSGLLAGAARRVAGELRALSAAPPNTATVGGMSGR